MASTQAAPVTGTHAGGGGIAMGRPAANQEEGTEQGNPAQNARLLVNCPHLNLERQFLEYPPGDPLSAFGVSFDRVDDSALVWVMVIVLGRFTFCGQQSLNSSLKVEVEYGDAADAKQFNILRLTSQSVSIGGSQGVAGSMLDFDSVLGFPWRSDFIPKLSLKVYQAGKVLGRRLPLVVNPRALRQTLGQQSLRLPFQLQFPQRIAQEILLQSPKSDNAFGAIQFAADFKQISVGLLRKGGMEMFTALLTPSEFAIDAPAMSGLANLGADPWVLGQSIAASVPSTQV